MDYKSQIMRVIINHPGATRAYIEKHCGGKHSSTTTHRLHEMLALGFIRREKSVIRGGNGSINISSLTMQLALMMRLSAICLITKARK
jgi:hypothetical protein